MNHELKCRAMTNEDLAAAYQYFATRIASAGHGNTDEHGMRDQKLIELSTLVFAGANLGLEIERCSKLWMSDIDPKANQVAIKASGERSTVTTLALLIKEANQ